MGAETPRCITGRCTFGLGAGTAVPEVAAAAVSGIRGWQLIMMKYSTSRWIEETFWTASSTETFLLNLPGLGLPPGEFVWLVLRPEAVKFARFSGDTLCDNGVVGGDGGADVLMGDIAAGMVVLGCFPKNLVEDDVEQS